MTTLLLVRPNTQTTAFKRKTAFNIPAFREGILIIFLLICSTFCFGKEMFEIPGNKSKMHGNTREDPSTVCYVDASKYPSGNGTSWDNAYQTLKEALSEAASNLNIKVIYIATGNYYPTGEFFSSSDRTATFSILRGGLKLMGGYPAKGLGSRNIFENPTILNGDIYGNVSLRSHHVMVIAGLSAQADSVIIDGFRVINGRADGGGSRNYNGQSIANNKGGGIVMSGNLNNQKIVIRNCIISGNYAADAGAGMATEKTSALIINSVFSGNYADYGGAMINGDQSNHKILNCTISGNHDNHGGGGMRNSSSKPEIINTIIYGNDGGISNNSSTPVISYSLVQGLTATTNGNLVGTTNPLFVNALNVADAPVVGGNYRIQSTSPCYNKGSNTAYSAAGGNINNDFDLWKNKRLFDVSIDIGANEYVIPLPDEIMYEIYVKKGAGGDNRGKNWDSAYTELAEALKYARKHASEWTASKPLTIYVAKGTYKPLYNSSDANFTNEGGRASAFVLIPHVKIYGSFVGNETITPANVNNTISTRNFITNNSILSGDIDDNNIVDNGNVYSVVISATCSNTTVLDGFTIKGGYGNGDGSTWISGEGISFNWGAGIQIVNSSAIFANLTVTENIAASLGAGIYIGYSTPTFINVAINKNRSYSSGGGMYYMGSSPTLTNVSIQQNIASNWGGGIYSVSDYIRYNPGTSALPLYTNVLMSGNTAETGGAMYIYGGSPIFSNVTIIGNNATNSIDDGIYNREATLGIRNSIIYGNTAGITGNGLSNISYSLVKGLSGTSNGNLNATGILATDIFIDANNGNYRLKSGSPAINKGNNAFFNTGQTPDLSAIKTDLDNRTRIMYTIDLGPYESMVAPLPVVLLSYTAHAEQNQAKLNWTTAYETKNKKFIISRSTDGRNFVEIGNVPASLNSNASNNYVFFDTSPENGINYYRLEQQDMDGKITYLGIRILKFSFTNEAMKFYPNPAKDNLKIEFSAGKYHSLELMDNNGKVLRRVTVGILENQVVINLSNLASGVYFVRLSGKNSVVNKVVKE